MKVGAKAKEKLEEATENGVKLPASEMTEIRKAINAGSRSQSTLMISALPLLKKAASTEFQRRKAWKSRVSYDDILQEAILGFLRGLLSYDETKEVSSPTNYLMQWAVTTVRRKVEALEHDFSIPYETIERTRKIIAIRSRLTGEMNRVPTDLELLDALNSNTGHTSAVGFKWGRVSKDPNAVRKQKYTLDQVEKSLELMPMLYAFGPNETAGADPNGAGEGAYEQEAYSLFSEPYLSHETVINDSMTEEARTGFLMTVFEEIGMSALSTDIIVLHFGLRENPARNYTEIAKELNTQPKTVKNVVSSFTEYMAKKNGIFHRLLSEATEDELADFEFGWLVNILGEYNPNEPALPPKILVG